MKSDMVALSMEQCGTVDRASDCNSSTENSDHKIGIQL